MDAMGNLVHKGASECAINVLMERLEFIYYFVFAYV